jgi:hypothetical protein
MSREDKDSPHECAQTWIANADGSWMRVWDLCQNEPEAAWAVLKEIYEQHPSADTLCRLATGPLAELLHKHGVRVIGRAETLGWHEERFARVLAQIPRRGMFVEVWRRVRGAVEKWPSAQATGARSGHPYESVQRQRTRAG